MSDSSDHHLWWIGLILAIGAQFFGATGNHLVKSAHEENDHAPFEKKRPLYTMKFWLLGMFCIVVLNTVLNLVAFVFAGQAILAPVAGLSILFNVLLSKFHFKSEQIVLLDWLSSLLCVAGIGVASGFGPHNTTNYDIHAILDLTDEAPFKVYAPLFLGVLTSLALGSALAPTAVARICAPMLVGFLGDFTAVFSKASVEILKSASNRGGDDMHVWQSYICFALAIASAVAQLVCLNRALKKYSVLVVVPVYQATMVVMHGCSGIVVWMDYHQLDTLGYAMFSLGVALTACGIYVTMYRRRGDAAGADSASKPEGERPSDDSLSLSGTPLVDVPTSRHPSAAVIVNV